MNSDEQEAGENLPELTAASLNSLKTAGPWMFFIGVLGFISCGVVLIFGVLMMAAVDFLSEFAGDKGLLIGMVYIGTAVFCFFVSRFLVVAASNIRALKNSASAEILESALKNIASYWKLSGIACAAGIVLALIGIIITII
ncbi:MAG: hypothetical protein LBH18_05155 [Spirochaetaceae bacterium]|jgi:hypothetical protein|nr:hypothetical protein [Spirochaetaceae bacterium]